MFIIPTIQAKINTFVRVSQNFIHFFFQCKRRCVKLFGPLFDDLFCLFVSAVVDDWHTFFDDPGLFPCDLFDRISEDLRVIQADRSDHRRDRMFDRVGRIESSAKTGLQNHVFCLFFLKSNHGNRIEQLKISCMRQSVFYHAVNGCLYFLIRFQKKLVADRYIVDLETFVDPNQMRRGKKGGLFACQCQHL